ncbi:hypothetical protein BDV59DRAFT_189014 [Aspergillus ambiguus]|uniref:uncharacterized protein n=1 Tax=Aspergillus ambiguus TaxID=176160 RepID=UPI003CCD5827
MFDTIPAEMDDNLVDCCTPTCNAQTIADIIANPDPEALQSFLTQGWHHFVHKQRDYGLPIAVSTPELADADASVYWAAIKRRFCEQTKCRFSPNFTFGLFEEYSCHSALTVAIRSQSKHHVALLLSLAANPDAFELSLFEKFQALFLRFRPTVDLNMGFEGDIGSREEILAKINTAQTVHITNDEVEVRMPAEFWTSRDCYAMVWDRRHEEPAPALVIAAGLGSTVIVDQLMDHDADHSFWTAYPSLTAIPEPPTPSSLALSSPIHEAIASGNTDMLRHLLGKGLNPNVLPLGYIQGSITPLMATLLDSESWNEAAYELLANDPRIDWNVRTPYMVVHILHIAAAHSLQVLKRIEQNISLECAGRTAYGHNLLHIACLPLAIQRHASKARESIRNLRPGWPRVRNDRGFWSSLDQETLSLATCEAEFSAQLGLLQYLLASGTQQVTAYDSDLNTPLHYLAGARAINEEAIRLLRAQDEGQVAWSEMRNWYGYTAKEIWEQAHRVRGIKDSWYGGTTRKVATLPTICLR